MFFFDLSLYFSFFPKPPPQEKVPMIVMLTNLVENGKKKCDKYWPEVTETLQWGDEESQNGVISVKVDEEKEYATFVKRAMTIEKNSSYSNSGEGRNKSVTKWLRVIL